ncbi:MAG: hypothetical protein A2857_01990 [Candidatus Levybacteria bacterium RIFCSPHIGHO2_01_FULL_36_15]|nr:MAG: hypothetical protein A2857_01990 [Candidatus Levybacteria bacterium RIFCSPHIGHO2_01_FULL_36_15]
MNAVIDEDLHRSFGVILSELGFTIFDIRDHVLRGHQDDEIFQFAQTHKAVLFSGDLGFSNTLSFPLGTHCGIVILRFPNAMSTKMINNIVKKLLGKLKTNDYVGNLIIVSPGKLRIRRHKKNRKS